MELRKLKDEEFINAPRPVRAIYIANRLGESIPTLDLWNIARENPSYFEETKPITPDWFEEYREAEKELMATIPVDRGGEWWIHNPEDFIAFASARERVEKELAGVREHLKEKYTRKEEENVEA